MIKKGISVVICSYNSEHRIKRVLGCLSAQQNCDDIEWEVIMVDNASKDNTAKVAKELWKRNEIPFKVISEPNPGLSNARRTGINNSKFSFISFIDDDNWVCENWIETTYEIMVKNPNVGICGGLGEPVFENSPPVWFKEIQHAYAVGPQQDKEGILSSEIQFLYGAGITIRKEAWNRLMSKNFKFLLTGRKGKSLSSGEDYELCLALKFAGYSLYYSPRLKFKHYMFASRLNLKYLRHLFAAFGKSRVILMIYIAYLLYPDNIKRYLYTNYLLSVIHTTYSLLKSIITSVNKINFNKYNLPLLHIIYNWNYLIETIKQTGRFQKLNKLVKANIKN